MSWQPGSWTQGWVPSGWLGGEGDGSGNGGDPPEPPEPPAMGRAAAPGGRNRARLLTDVESWLARDDIIVSDSHESILAIAEDYLATDMRLVAQERSVERYIAGRRVAAPDDFLTWRALFLDGVQLRYVTPEVLRETGDHRSPGLPALYSVEGAANGIVQFVFAPPGVADKPAVAELLYFARFAPLVFPEDTNWLLINHYSVYLYATLRAAAEWAQEIDLEAKYAAQYAACVERVNRAEQRRRFGAVAKSAAGLPRTVV